MELILMLCIISLALSMFSVVYIWVFTEGELKQLRTEEADTFRYQACIMRNHLDRIEHIEDELDIYHFDGESP